MQFMLLKEIQPLSYAVLYEVDRDKNSKSSMISDDLSVIIDDDAAGGGRGGGSGTT